MTGCMNADQSQVSHLNHCHPPSTARCWLCPWQLGKHRPEGTSKGKHVRADAWLMNASASSTWKCLGRHIWDCNMNLRSDSVFITGNLRQGNLKSPDRYLFTHSIVQDSFKHYGFSDIWLLQGIKLHYENMPVETERTYVQTCLNMKKSTLTVAPHYFI